MLMFVFNIYTIIQVEFKSVRHTYDINMEKIEISNKDGEYYANIESSTWIYSDTTKAYLAKSDYNNIKENSEEQISFIKQHGKLYSINKLRTEYVIRLTILIFVAIFWIIIQLLTKKHRKIKNQQITY